MTMGPAEGLSSVLGEALNELGGFRVTRLTTQLLPAQSIQTGINNATSVDGQVITIASATFGATVLAGQRFTLRSGAANGESALIQSVDSTTQITLVAALPSGAFTSESFDIQTEPETTANVETTLDWPASGSVYIDGVLYGYASKTLSTLDGLTHSDGVETITGAKQQHEPLSEVLEYSRSFSGLEQYRASLLVGSASGEDLDIIGSNLGVPRPPQLTDDDTYRKLIIALAYAPKATIFAMEQALDALLGETIIDTGTLTATSTNGVTVTLSGDTFDGAVVAGMRFRVTSAPGNPDLVGRTVFIDSVTSTTEIELQYNVGAFTQVSWEIADPNWEIFEDLTLGSINNPCTVFFRNKNNREEDSRGKAFVEGRENVPLTNTTSTTVTQSTPLHVSGVRLAPEPTSVNGRERLIAEGSNSASSVGGPGQGSGALPIVVTAPAASFPTSIHPGDVFHVLSGASAGARGTIATRDSDQQITLNRIRGVPNYQLDDASVSLGNGASFSTAVPTLISLTNATFPAAVMPGMKIRITDGVNIGLLGVSATILSVDSSRTFLNTTAAISLVGFTNASWEVYIPEGRQFNDVSWKITRPVSSFRTNRPSDETYLEYPSDPGTTIWTYEGTAAPEATFSTITDDATDGQFVRLTRGVAATSFYRHPLRVLPESRATFECTFRPPLGGVATETDALQMFMRIEDGERDLAIGFVEDGGGTFGYMGLYDTTLTRFINISGELTNMAAPAGNNQTITQTGGTFRADMVGRRVFIRNATNAGNNGYFTVNTFTDANNIIITNPNGVVEAATIDFNFGLPQRPRIDFTPFSTWKIVKDGRNEVRLYKDGALVDFAPYSEFATSSNRRIEFGAGGTNNTTVDVRQVDWSVSTNEFDLWNAHFPNTQTTVGEQVTDGDSQALFLSSDIGKTVRVRSTDNLGTNAANDRGEWAVSSFANANTVAVTGPTFYDCVSFDAAFPNRIVIDYPDAFIVPDHLDHDIQILDGSNAGTYTISRFIQLRSVSAEMASGAILIPPVYNISDGTEIVLQDANGVQITLEFDDDATVQVGNVAVDLSGSPTNAVLLQRLADAIDAQRQLNNINITTALSVGTLTLTQGVGGVGGNTPITTTHTGTSLIVQDFTGGADATTEIQDLTEADDGTTLATLANTSAASTDELTLIRRTNIVEVSNAPVGGFSTETGSNYRLIPNFVGSTGSVSELVAAGTLAGSALTFRQDLATHGITANELVEVAYSTVLSAQVLKDDVEVTNTTAPALTHYAFYLFDNFGLVRDVLDALTAAGVIPDFDSFVRDATGVHIVS